MKRRMKRKNQDVNDLSRKDMKAKIPPAISQLKQEIIYSIFLKSANLKTLKCSFSCGLPVESLIYILEAELSIKLVNGKYVATLKGIENLKGRTIRGAIRD